jgi:hypothetical protein
VVQGGGQFVAASVVSLQVFCVVVLVEFCAFCADGHAASIAVGDVASPLGVVEVVVWGGVV